MLPTTVEHIANLAALLDEPLQEKLWEYAELLYIEQVAFESSDIDAWSVDTRNQTVWTSQGPFGHLPDGAY